MHTAASHDTAKHGPSLLEIVAAHETSLMDKVSSTDNEVRKLLDDAHAEATHFLTEDYAQLERDVADFRRKGNEAREQEVAAIRAACEQKVAAVRQRAGAKLEQVFIEVVRRVLPSA